MLNNLRPALIITRREVRDQFRDWRITLPILILTLIFPWVMNFTATRAVNFVSAYGAEIIAERLIPFLLMVVGFFPISVSLVIALESFVGEKERGSIEPLLTSPLTDLQLYLGKLIAVMVPPMLASYLGIGIYLFGVNRRLGWVPDTELLIQILVLTFVQAFVMVSGAVVISTQTTSVRAANLLASFIIIPMSFLIQGESMVMFWGQYDTLWWAVGGLLVIAILLVRTGVSHFNREELLGRELDTLNFKWMFKEFVSGFIGKATSIVSWYRIEITKSLKSLQKPILLMIGLLIGSYFVGDRLSEMFTVPPEILEMINFNRGQMEGFDGFDRFSLFSSSGIRLIWFQNIRVILLATVLGVFSYGVLGIIVIMIPFALIGYFMIILSKVGLGAGTFLAAFILPHGIFEIPAILLAGAAILKMGAKLSTPSEGKSISEGLLHAFSDWAKIMLGIILPLLLAAAVIEALVTPRIAIWLLSQ